MSRSERLPMAADGGFSLESILTLLAHHEPAGLAYETLSALIADFGATAASLLYAGHPRLHVRRGEMPPTVAAQMDRWEAAIEERLAAGDWEIAGQEGPSLASQPVQGSEYVAIHTLLRSDQRVVGSLLLVYPRKQVPQGPQRARLGIFVQALSHMLYLLGELSLARARLGQLSLLYQVSQTMASTLDLGKVLENTTQLAGAVSDASTSALVLIEREGGQLVFEYTHGEMGDRLYKQRTAADEGIAGQVATSGEPVLNNDARNDPCLSSGVEAQAGLLTRSVLCVPVQIRGRTIGALEVLNKRGEGAFDAEDLSLMITMANQAAIAIENARLYQSLRDERDRIIQAQEVVRRQVARNLHDGTIQFLSAISMGINHLEHLLELKPEAAGRELEALRDLARQGTKQARLALFELRPVILETQGLAAALETYVQQLEGSEEPGIHLELEPSLPNLTNSVASTVFAIVQEAVTNAKKHAAPHDIWLRLSQSEDWLEVTVEDNGSGFDPETVEEAYDHQCSLGLLSMRERAELIDGQLTIESYKSPPRTGTRVVLRLPVSTGSSEAARRRKDGQGVL